MTGEVASISRAASRASVAICAASRARRRPARRCRRPARSPARIPTGRGRGGLGPSRRRPPAERHLRRRRDQALRRARQADARARKRHAREIHLHRPRRGDARRRRHVRNIEPAHVDLEALPREAVVPCGGATSRSASASMPDALADPLPSAIFRSAPSVACFEHRRVDADRGGEVPSASASRPSVTSAVSGSMPSAPASFSRRCARGPRARRSRAARPRSTGRPPSRTGSASSSSGGARNTFAMQSVSATWATLQRERRLRLAGLLLRRRGRRGRDLRVDRPPGSQCPFVRQQRQRRLVERTDQHAGPSSATFSDGDEALREVHALDVDLEAPPRERGLVSPGTSTCTSRSTTLPDASGSISGSRCTCSLPSRRPRKSLQPICGACTCSRSSGRSSSVAVAVTAKPSPQFARGWSRA